MLHMLQLPPIFPFFFGGGGRFQYLKTYTVKYLGEFLNN
jgi:hypothetical protein